jgi:hypothetical protein
VTHNALCLGAINKAGFPARTIELLSALSSGCCSMQSKGEEKAAARKRFDADCGPSREE